MGAITKAERKRREEEKNKPCVLAYGGRVTHWIDDGFNPLKPGGFELFKVEVVNKQLV